MLVQKANILGLLCSDGNYRGYISRYIEFDKRRNNYYKREINKRIIEFANVDLKLLKTFQNLLSSVYNYKPKITISNNNVFRVCITKNSVIDDILKKVKLGSNNWFVPNFVINGTKPIKIGFLQGFFDGDGSVDIIKNKIPRIRFSSINIMGLKQLRKLLDSLNIKSVLNGPYKRKNRKDIYEILLKTESIEKFIKSIKSAHPKKRKLMDIISRGNYQCRGRLS